MLEKQLCLKTSSRQGRVLGVPCKHKTTTKHSKPLLILNSFTQRVKHNQDSPVLADAPKGRKVGAIAMQSQLRTQTQLRRMGRQDTSKCSSNHGKSDFSNPLQYTSLRPVGIFLSNLTLFEPKKFKKIIFWTQNLLKLILIVRLC